MSARIRLAVLFLGAFPALAGAGPFTSKGTQPLPAHPLQTSGACTVCHGDYDAAHTVEPGPTWEGSMMAQSARDPLFWAALDVANHDLPGVGEWCLRCHAPRGWLAGRAEPPGGSADGCALQGRLDERDNDFDGVTCHLCHRMQVNPAPPPGQAAIYFENAQFWLDDTDCGGQGEPCRHGPYDYLVGGLPAPHPWAYSEYVRSSELCAACHNVTNPVKNLIVGGVDQGFRFPIERTYREWQLSDFGLPFGLPGSDFTSCQGCHMPESGVSPVFASAQHLNDRTGALSVHDFVGGNAWIPEVLRVAYPALGLGPSLARTRDLARDVLMHASAEVEVTAAPWATGGGALDVDVRVTNLTGHKLPTGYPEGRRMWLHVEARDGNGALVWESGAYDPATGVLTGLPVPKVYQAKQGIWNAGTSTCETEAGGGAELFHFALNDCVAEDDRIPPKGFVGGTDLQTQPVGYLYPETQPGVLAHWDTTHYSIPLPPATRSPVTVTARLRYQTASKEYVEFLRDQADTHGFPDDCTERTGGFPGRSRGALVHDLWAATDRSPPVDMGTAAGTVAVAATDAFVCLKARTSKGAAKFVPVPGLVLADDLATGTFDARALASLCAPADTGAGTVDGSTHLLGYRLRAVSAVAFLPRAGLGVETAFGPLTLDAVKPQALLVPAARGMTAPDPASHAVDHFACWKARSSAGAASFPGALATVADGVTGRTRTLELKKPRTLCLAVDRDGVPRENPAAGLVCYQTRPLAASPKPLATGVAVADALRTLVVDAVREDVLCVPAVAAP
jgi:hypothetical protein